jgi:rhodanese-related sulfurtransferase
METEMTTLNEYQRKYSSFFLIFCALCIFAVNNYLHDKPLNIINVSPVQAKALIDTGALVFDVREKEAFEFRHIPGAISIPLNTLESGVPTDFDYAKTKDIVVYCGGGVTKGPVATNILNKAGFTKAVNVKPGIQGWVDAGYPIEKAVVK